PGATAARQRERRRAFVERARARATAGRAPPRDGPRAAPRWRRLHGIHPVAVAVGWTRDLAVALLRRRARRSPLSAPDRAAAQEPLRAEPLPVAHPVGAIVVRAL